MLAAGTAQQILGRAASALATFVALALAARALAPEGFAAVGAYLALWAILDVAIDGGSMSASLRAMSLHPALASTAIARARAVRAALLPPAYLIVVLCAAREEPALCLWVLGASLGLAAHLLAPATLPLHRELRFRAIAFARGAGAWLAALTVIALAAAECGAPGPYLGAFALGSVANALIAWRAAPPVVPSATPCAIDLRAYLREAVALGGAALARTAYFWIDALLVRELAGEAEAGGYNAAYRLFNLALLVATYAGASALPLFAAACEEQHSELARLGRALALGGLGLALAVATLAEPLLVLCFGADYAPAAPALRALAVAIAAVHVSSWTFTRLTAEGRSGVIAALSFVALALNLALDLWWIPSHGALGAAWATSATEVAVMLLALAAPRRGGER